MITHHTKNHYQLLVILLLLITSNCNLSCNDKENPSKTVETLDDKSQSESNLNALQPVYNLEAIDLGIEQQENLSFSFNNKDLTKEGELYLSDELIVCYDPEKKWQATAIGNSGIRSSIKIYEQGNLLKEINIQTTYKVFPYEDQLGPEWPGIVNIGNTCFSNAVYKLMARCPGFDQALSQNQADALHTTLRNIINGIRLGKRSAFHQAAIQRRLIALSLDLLTSAIKQNNYNDRTQHDGILLLIKLIFLLHENQNNPFEITFKKIHREAGTSYTTANSTSDFNLPPTYFDSSKIVNFLPIQWPQYMVAQKIFSNNNNTIAIPEKVTRDLFDQQTNQKIGEKNYKIIGLIHHIGPSNDSGHYVAYINFNGRWYKQDDSRVSPIDPIHSLKGEGVLALYELQAEN